MTPSRREHRKRGAGKSTPNAYIYFTIQEQNWAQTCKAISKPEWAEDPAYATAKARQSHIFDLFAEIEKWLADKTKFEAVDILRVEQQRADARRDSPG